MQDSEYKENPLERENKEERAQVSSVKSLHETYDDIKKKYKNIDLVRVPVAEDNAPKEASIDILIDSLKQEPASTQCVFSCQAGMGRTTLGTLHSGLFLISNHPMYCRHDHCLSSKRNTNLLRAEENG